MPNLLSICTALHSVVWDFVSSYQRTSHRRKDIQRQHFPQCHPLAFSLPNRLPKKILTAMTLVLIPGITQTLTTTPAVFWLDTLNYETGAVLRICARERHETRYVSRLN